MIDAWLEAIEDLVLDAPGNDDPSCGDTWESTICRLTAHDKADAKEHRVFFDYFEAQDVAPSRPFFVLVEREVAWRKFATEALHCEGVVEVCYTERAHHVDDDADPVSDNRAHKDSKKDFAGWVGQLFADCASRVGSVQIQFAAIEMEIAPTRTPRNLRDPTNLDSDYWWTRWAFVIGESENPR